jgi:hypothetical protein
MPLAKPGMHVHRYAPNATAAAAVLTLLSNRISSLKSVD